MIFTQFRECKESCQTVAMAMSSSSSSVSGKNLLLVITR